MRSLLRHAALPLCAGLLCVAPAALAQPAATPTPGMPLAAEFDRADQNRDGVLSEDEAKRAGFFTQESFSETDQDRDGTITLFIGTQTNGQGHATAYSQFIADKIGIDFDRIIVRQGDTAELAKGGGTGGSRSIPLGGVSVSSASDGLAEKMKRIAGDELEAAVEDIELVGGQARVVGTDQTLSFAAIAAAAWSCVE